MKTIKKRNVSGSAIVLFIVKNIEAVIAKIQSRTGK